MKFFHCDYLNSNVEMTEERAAHIAERHPELLPVHEELIAETLAEPDQIRRSIQFGNARLFTRWYTDLRRGKHVVAVVVSERSPNERHWIVTAYLTGKMAKGIVEWERN
jgi:hypothetical protein